ncbi:hypothetical protein PIB30_075630 [Stylosanthes scabra]|uniref:GRAM domain-containing protein n=1 Tax=Stylosanthes scabra TaxID=79078 RepID=A0ABU6ZNQ3_9FABA|nr:hypothetical protein [Stylosanthes scabra]
MKSFVGSPRKCFSSSNSDDSFESTKTSKENVEWSTRKKGSSFTSTIHEHVKLGSKMSETSKGKLNLGSNIIQKVLIPIQKIREVNEIQNVNKLKERYIEIVTKDEYEFWCMGFVSLTGLGFSLTVACGKAILHSG